MNFIRFWQASSEGKKTAMAQIDMLLLDPESLTRLFQKTLFFALQEQGGIPG